MITSTAKTIPAMGALKIAAIDAAEAHPSIKITYLYSRRKNLLNCDPIAAPVDTVGPSSPTEPPNPTVNAEVITDENVLCLLMNLFLFEMPYSTFGIPCRTGFRKIYLINITVRVSPITVSYTHLRAHETRHDIVCRLL